MIIRRSRRLLSTFTSHARKDLRIINGFRRHNFWWRKTDEPVEAVVEAKVSAEEPVGEPPKEAVAETASSESSEESAVDGEAFLPVAKDPPHFKIKDVLVLPTNRPLLPGIIEPFILHDRRLSKYLLKLAKENPDSNLFIGVFHSKDSEGEAEENEEEENSENEDSTSSKSRARKVLPANRLRLSNVHRTGILAQIVQLGQVPNNKGHHFGDLQLLVRGVQRIEIKDVVESYPLRVSIKHLMDSKSDKEKVTAFYQQIQKGISDLKDSQQGDMFRKRWEYYTAYNTSERDNVVTQCDIAAYSLTSIEKEKLQIILDELDIETRLDLILQEIIREQRVHKVMGEVQSEVEQKLHNVQREHILKEHMKKIKKELGMEKDEKTTLLQRFKERLENKIVPKAINDVIDEEMNKLSTLESASSEFNVTRNYLDWLTIMPYSIRSEEVFNLKEAVKILDEDHYGMEEVKDRILEFIAVGKMKKSTSQGKIICLTGPPGVGKTSIGKSISRALGREFYRFSVGGLGDISEIKGHRRTYVGAMPGKFVQAFKRTEVENPLILIDEIDKLGTASHGRGDASSALLEALDPNQNDSFMDHYMDVPLDLSKVLFICTANDKSLIPGPLADRMEFVDLSGYLVEEKLEIAKRYLIKKSEEMSGLPHQVRVEDNALKNLIRWYCREAGVRNLEKHIERIYRKCARKVVEAIEIEELEKAAEKAAAEEALKAELIDEPPVEPQVVIIDQDGEELEKLQAEEEIVEPEPGPPPEPTMIITDDNLEDFVGKPVFTSDRLYEQTPVGTTMGLAYTSLGGTTLYVESAATSYEKDKGGSLKCTGRLGETMSESAQIAFSHAKAFLTKHYPENTFFKDHDIHLSVIEAATPKDGPSAGCTIVTSLLSLALDRPVLDNFALTGEVSLTGRVLKIGGVREKIVAAKRSGATVLCFPAENRKDFDELPEYVKDGVTVHFVQNYKEVFDIALAEA